ncbi:patatin [Bordetella pseudohinzii]|uniref:Patatin n=1 Tax=Bordetella pseudohinzii TaxID=1331258 RepID=A0ABM6DK35_9BORD|nr:patatin [Bordetella pseudohinzii]KMM25126.1 patatin [Bordetella pseudohinzii]KXA80383.1 patatin [Bordetella pseudohinzii]KXA81474.1 patatin [Bordetella pseudohinzii]
MAFVFSICLGAAVSGCSSVDTAPINTVSEHPRPASPRYIPDAGDDGTTVVALAFSGGGMRAAAWAYGALLGLDSMVVDNIPYRRTLLDNVRSVAGTSGGAVMAAYLGWKGKDEFEDFRERFLYQDAESHMATKFHIGTIITAALSGGANDRQTFARWLDEQVFDHATFASLHKPENPVVWLTASDIYNNTPFLFTPDVFAALCSDLDNLKIADAVAASAAFPGAFAPVNIETPKKDCQYVAPAWLHHALNSASASVRLRAYARALESYHSSDLPYVRLLDGGLTDNLGITGLTLDRAAAQDPYGPLSPRQAVRLRRFLFIVTDAGVQPGYSWGGQETSVRLDQLLVAAFDTAMASTTRMGLDAVTLALQHWQTALITYRCGLSSKEVLELRGTLKDWDCADVSVTAHHISFRDADAALFDRLNTIPTRLTLPRQDIDLLIDAARQAVVHNRAIASVVTDAKKEAPVFDGLPGVATDFKPPKPAAPKP